MPGWIYVLLIILITQRLTELWIAKRNEDWLKHQGAIEIGKKHYKWFVRLHVAFFIAMLFEMRVMGHIMTVINPYFLTLFVLAQIGRIWCIFSLGRYWNTKIIILPDRFLVTKGPYKYVAHPNYIIVGAELCIIPLLFGAYITALVFPLMHVLLLMVRIPVENKALKTFSSTITK